MIEVKLLVEAYCHSCPFFKPNVVNRRHYENFECSHDVTVGCEYKEHCGYLMNHLSKKDGGK